MASSQENETIQQDTTESNTVDRSAYEEERKVLLDRYEIDAKIRRHRHTDTTESSNVSPQCRFISFSGSAENGTS